MRQHDHSWVKNPIFDCTRRCGDLLKVSNQQNDFINNNSDREKTVDHGQKDQCNQATYNDISQKMLNENIDLS